MSAIHEAIVAILRADYPKEYTAKELLEQVQRRRGWRTRTTTPQKTFDARLAGIIGGPEYPIDKKKTDHGTVFFYSPEKAKALDADMAPREPLDVPPITIRIHSKTAITGRAEVDHLVKALRAFQDAVVAFGKLNRGAGGQSPSNYSLEVVAPLAPGSLIAPVAPLANEGLEACEATFRVLSRPRETYRQFRKQVEPIEKLRKLVGVGRPLKALDLDWGGRDQSWNISIDDNWFDSLPLDLEEDREPPRWLSLVTADTSAVVGIIEEIDKAGRTFRVRTDDQHPCGLAFDDEAVFSEGIDRYRWKRVAVLCNPAETDESHRTQTHLFGSHLRAIDVRDLRDEAVTWGEQEVRALHERIRTVAGRVDDQWMRALRIMQWTAVCANARLTIPHASAGNPDAGVEVGLWFKDPVTGRELDLDYTEGAWCYLKTPRPAELRREDAATRIEELVEEGRVETDLDLMDLAEWASGMGVEETSDE